MLVNSEPGIRLLMDFARAHRFVLSLYHEKIAKRFDVSTEGVLFSRPIPA